jgi:hypothetical protein
MMAILTGVRCNLNVVLISFDFFVWFSFPLCLEMVSIFSCVFLPFEFLQVTEANRRRGSGTREKVSLRRINLEFNIYVHGSNAKNIPV